MSPRAPLGQQVHLALVRSGSDAAVAIARSAGHPDLFERVTAVASAAPSPNFLHSALCAMSLPVRRPADEHAPIIRQDGQYTLVINPKPVVESGGRPAALAKPWRALWLAASVGSHSHYDRGGAHRSRDMWCSARPSPTGCGAWGSGRSVTARAARPR